MIRKLLLPAVAAVLLAGCVSAGYSYRQGSGDYYHGTPRVEYRYYGAYGPYGYYGPYRYDSAYYRYYRHGYPYRYYYRGYPYGYRYRNPYDGDGRNDPPRVDPPRVDLPRIDRPPDRPRSPWRDLDRLGDRDEARSDRRDNRISSPVRIGNPVRVSKPVRPSAPPPRPQTRTTSGKGSAISGILRRTRERDHKNESP